MGIRPGSRRGLARMWARPTDAPGLRPSYWFSCRSVENTKVARVNSPRKKSIHDETLIIVAPCI